MSDTLTRYLVKYPNARTTTLQYLAKREETTEQLRKEVLAALAGKPRSETAIRRMMRGIAEFVARIG